MKINIYITFIIFAAAIILSGCAKDGALGPQGAQGPAGNANVTGTSAITVNWTLVNNKEYDASIPISAITQDVVNTGSITVYVKYTNGWYILPDIQGNNSTTYGIGLGVVNLINSNSDSSTPAYPSSNIFRVVVIPSSARIANPGTNMKNEVAVDSNFPNAD